LAQGGLAASRLGFRGSEDLGGGMRAEFWLEAALDPDTGTVGVTSINGGRNNAAALFTRRSTASLLGGWGEVRLGRDQTATYLNTPIFDPFGDNGLGAASNLTLQPPAVPVGGGYDTLARANNMVAYFLPSGIAGGLYGLVQVAAGESVYGNKFFGGRVGYASGPFNAALAYGRTQVDANTDGDNFNVAGSWGFGFMTLSGFYGQIKVAGDKQNNWFIGASAPIGLWTLRASYGQADRSGTSPANVDGQKANQLAVGAVYDLSKRTAVYGTWSGINNKGGAHLIVGSLINVPGGGAAANGDSQGFEFGLKHAF
jgi:predicted porin